MGVVCLFSSVARVSNKNIHNYFYNLYFVSETIFVIDKIIGLPAKNDSLLFFQHCFMGDYDHYKVLNVIMTIKVLLRLATHEQLCDVRMCCVCKLDI